MSSAGVPKILIISSDTGGGHKSAAAAIVAGVQKFWEGDSYAVRVVRAVEESHHLSAKMVAVYNWVLRNRQHWMKYVYWFVNRFRPESRGFLYRRSLSYIHDLFERWCPHVVVSVHPLTQHAFARVLKELGLAGKIPLVTVVTDPCYGFWKGWACDDVTLYLVASDEARRQLIDYGVQPERIKVSGMPVHPKFELPDERSAQAARSAWGSTRRSSPSSSTRAGSAAVTSRRFSESLCAASWTFRLSSSRAATKSCEARPSRSRHPRSSPSRSSATPSRSSS
jgi:UDP-N-acetylglucosamine:LPS N-acetylglucosamine transferase